MRAELHKILAEARAAKTMPWDASKVSLYQTIFPQMANWLREEEAAQLLVRLRDGNGATEGGVSRGMGI